MLISLLCFVSIQIQNENFVCVAFYTAKVGGGKKNWTVLGCAPASDVHHVPISENQTDGAAIPRA